MPQFSVGEVILNGKYRIEKLLGEGAFGEVYLATHLNLKALRALKVLRKEGESGVGSTVYGHARRRFLQESALGEKLGSHPHIIQVMDFDEVEDLMVLALEYAPGGSLQKRLESLREEGQLLPVADVLRIAVEVTEGLALLHKMDVVHRDLKPGNILFDKEGRAKVADFGLAQVPHSDSRRSVLSMPEPHPGTPGYMSPEQTRPPYDVLTPASDIYAMGAMLFEMLTGRSQHIQRPGTRPSDLRAGVPVELDDLVLRMLADTPRERPWDGAETARLLGTIEQDLAGLRTREAAQAAAKARLAAEEQTRREVEEKTRLASEAQVRQQVAEREKARQAADAQARRNAEEPARRKQETQQPVAVVTDIHSDASITSKVGSRKRLPNWGWQLGVSVLLSLFFLVVRWGGWVTSDEPPQAYLADAPEPPVCTEVGQAWVSPVDGMTLVCVPEGEFSMGSNVGDDNEKPGHGVYMDAYWIDQTEVTNGQYAQCVAAGGCTAPADTNSSTQASYYGNSVYDDYPVIYVNWNQAVAYCAWAGRSLPTEAQWEKAARGTDGRIYPWGNDAPSSTLLNYYKYVGDTTAVGSYPSGASPYGALDMAGNVWELTADRYGSYRPWKKNNPTGPATGEYRVLRGGGWFLNESYVRTSVRDRYFPGGISNDFGFRCARSLPPTQAPVLVLTAAPIAAPTAVPTTVPTAAPTLDASVPPACKEIGQTWVSPVDGMTLVCVPAGKFSMGSNDGSDDEKPVHDVNLDAYWMDQTDVTNGQYAQCVAAGSCTAPQSTGSRTRGSYYGNSSYDDYPVINVTWYQATAYCAWAGRELPTEAQWEKAARGTEGYIYPWGNTFDGTKLNFADKNTNSNWSDKNVDDGYADTAPVGSYPDGASPYGALDMAGNVWEWTADWHGPYPAGELTNPSGPATGKERVLRGGSWIDTEVNLRSSNRGWVAPDFSYLSYVGFRCSRSLP